MADLCIICSKQLSDGDIVQVIRRSPETCVLQLEGQIRDGKYCAFSPLDLLELKAGLLNYGK